MKRLFMLFGALSLAWCVSRADEGRLLRFPAVGGETVVFSYAGDLYSVPVTGGEAKKLTYGDSYDVFPKISPDGQTIAFTGQFDGNTEVYTLPIDGGEPQRVTFSATLDRDNIGDRMGPNNIVMGWTPDGKKIIYRSRWTAFCSMRGVLCEVDAAGGFPDQIPTTEGGFCSYSPDGKQFAFNRMFREFRTWKHYRGGQAADIWINRVGTTKCERLFSDSSQNIVPMWIGEDIYFISDRDFTMNLFKYNTKSGETTKLTDFKEYDVKFPAASSKYIVFENGGYIYRYTVATGRCDKISVTLNDNHLASRPQVRRSLSQSGYSISPDGERVLVTARGELFSLPAEKGAVYNLSRTPAGHERNADWSPDGKYIAYFSDKSGEYQLYLLDTSKMDTPEEAECVTSFTDGYPQGLLWSNDAKTIYFGNEKRELYAFDVASKRAKCIIKSDLSPIMQVTVSPDNRWLSYVAQGANRINVVYLYSIESGTSTPVTSTWYDSYSPEFSDDGKYIFFVSSRNFSLNYSSVEWNSSYNVNNYMYVLPLAKDTPLPTDFKANEFKPIVVDASKGDDKKKDDKNNKEESKKEDDKSMKVDLDNIVARSSLLLDAPGNYSLIAAIDGKLYYYNGAVRRIELNSMKDTEMFSGQILAYANKSSKVLIREGGGLKVCDLKNPSQKQNVPVGGLNMTVVPKEEWKQLFEETWRIYRDHFYVTNMHGVDWKAMHDRYAALLPYVNHRQDLTYIISEMIGELCVGHTYITTGEAPSAPRVKVGLLGAKLNKEGKGFYKIEKIYAGFEGDASQRSPLSAPGVNANEGDYIVAVDGISTTEYSDIYEALVGKVGTTVALDLNKKGSPDGARRVYVKPIADDTQLAYYDWVMGNIAKVDKMSDGQVGYIHIPDMGPDGMNMFTKLFYSQLDKRALVIDDRMNGGGNVSPMILERLQREVYRMTMARNGRVNTVPGEAHYGPKVCLVDKYSMSDGDLFPYGFKKMGLGKLMGMRTWGGIVGITGSKSFIDGQELRTPFFTSYSLDGNWMVENQGVTPDIEVDINPYEDYLGNDEQLNRAVKLMLDEMKNYPELPGVPQEPVRVVVPK